MSASAALYAEHLGAKTTLAASEQTSAYAGSEPGNCESGHLRVRRGRRKGAGRKHTIPLSAEQWALVVKYLPAIDSEARKYYRKWRLAVDPRYTEDDAVADGRMGAIHAVGKWQPQGGLSYIGYAAIWVRSRIQRQCAKIIYGVYQGTSHVYVDGTRPPVVRAKRLAEDGGIYMDGNDSSFSAHPGGLATTDPQWSVSDVLHLFDGHAREVVRYLAAGDSLSTIAQYRLWEPGSARAGSWTGKTLTRERVRQIANRCRWVLRAHLDIMTEAERGVLAVVVDCRSRGVGMESITDAVYASTGTRLYHDELGMLCRYLGARAHVAAARRRDQRLGGFSLRRRPAHA